MKHISVLLLFVATGLIFAGPPAAKLDGMWKFEQEKSTNLAPWRYRVPQLVITTSPERVTILRQWMDKKRVAFTDSVIFQPGASPTMIPVRSPIWSGNWYIGALAKENSEKDVSGSWTESPAALRTVTHETLETSQGDSRITTTAEYTLSADGNTLTVTEQRSSRPTPIVLIFTRMENK